MIKISQYSDTDFKELVLFLKKNWAENHVLYRKELFDWQYRTKNGNASLVARDEAKIIGFLGNIPGEYSVKGEILRGAGLTMWVVAPEYMSSGLGILLLRETEKKYPVLITLGSKKEIVPLYEKLGFSHLPELQRFIMPLEEKGYGKLLTKPADAKLISAWAEQIFNGIQNIRPPENHVNPELLEKIYKEKIMPAYAFSLLRDAFFWRWRYLESAGYQYLFFGKPENEGLIVARIESVTAPDSQSQPLKVLRIIELIPAGEEFLQLLNGVLIWARDQKCVAADFQTSTLRLAPLLKTAGFRLQNENSDLAECSLADRFQPLQSRTKPINFLWRIRGSNGLIKNLDPNDTYFVKSDCDMDRPSI